MNNGCFFLFPSSGRNLQHNREPYAAAGKTGAARTRGMYPLLSIYLSHYMRESKVSRYIFIDYAMGFYYNIENYIVFHLSRHLSTRNRTLMILYGSYIYAIYINFLFVLPNFGDTV